MLGSFSPVRRFGIGESLLFGGFLFCFQILVHFIFHFMIASFITVDP